METQKVVLFLDRNKQEPFITNILNALREFLTHKFPKLKVCAHLEYEKNDFGVIFGIPCKYKINTKHRFDIHKKQRDNKRPLLVVERGFLRRDIYYSVGWNSIVGYGYYHNKNMPNDRFKQLNIEVKPQRNKKDGFILLCGQIPWDSQLHHIDYKEWLQNTVKEIKKYTSRKIVYRPHPKQSHKSDMSIWELPGTLVSTKPSLIDDMNEAFVVIAFNSNSVVEAMCEGIPFYAFDRGSMVYDLANKDLSSIEDPTFPSEKDIMQSLYDISYAQWNLEEIKSGLFWEHIKKGMNVSLANDYHITVPLLEKKPKAMKKFV